MCKNKLIKLKYFKIMENIEPNEDEKFVELFKKEHSEQFYVLVKMHLSFLLDMTTEETECFYEKVKLKKWNLVHPFTKKFKSKTAIETTVLNQNVLSQVHQLINFIKTGENLKAEGIFRRTGSLERQNELKNFLIQGITINFDDYQFTVHDCASVLKGFLADLPEPVFTDIQFPLYCQIAESFELDNPNHELKILQIVQLLFLLLPKENRLLLKDILEVLYLVTLKEESNRMSSENLAKLFTPHLLCPRKLTPECLLKDSQMLFATVAYMIKKYPKLLKIPVQLMIDIRSHYEQGNVLNESVKGAAHTVFTFVDNKLTAKENEENVTDAALAELYAHIQSLPESAKKRRLIKQFNKQNGHGTPLQVLRSSAPSKHKSFSDSIKKHMFHKNILRNMKKTGFSQMKNSSSEELLDSPNLITNQKLHSKGRLFCHSHDSSSDDDFQTPKRLRKYHETTPIKRTRSKSDSDLSIGESSKLAGQYLTSTPACILNRVEDIFTPDCQNRKSMSPITRSAQRMPKAMQETMMTPRSRKPVLLVSGTNINNLGKGSPVLTYVQEEQQGGSSSSNIFSENQENSLKGEFSILETETSHQPLTSETQKLNETNIITPKSLSTTFKQYLNEREMITFETPTDSTFSSRSDDFQSFNDEDLNNCEMQEIYENKLSDSMLYVMDGNNPTECLVDNDDGEKKLVLKPKQFDENGKAIVFETSF